MIGVFDSGFGGLTVLKEFYKKLPEYDFVYLGDNLRTPYGNRSQEAIYSFTKQGVDFLFEQGCELVIIACNTASAKALARIQREYLTKKKFGSNSTKRVLGVIRPLVEHICGNPKFKRVGLIATSSTIESKAYDLEIKKLKPNIVLYKSSAPLLVPLIEEGWINRKETKMILRYYLRDLKQKKIDSLILGCTHYPLIYKLIVQTVGRRVSVPHPGRIVADSLADYLKRHPEIETKCTKKGRIKFFTTDFPQKFEILGTRFFGQPIICAKATL